MTKIFQINQDNTSLTVKIGIFRCSCIFNKPEEDTKNTIYASSSYNSWHYHNSYKNRQLNVSQSSVANMMQGKIHGNSKFVSSYFIKDNTIFSSLADDTFFKNNSTIISGPLSVIYMLDEIFKDLPKNGILLISTINSHILVSMEKSVIVKMLIIPASCGFSEITNIIDLFSEKITYKDIYVSDSNIYNQISNKNNYNPFMLNYSEQFFQYFNCTSEMIPYIETLSAALCIKRKINTMLVSGKTHSQKLQKNIAILILLAGTLLFSGFNYNDLNNKNKKLVILNQKIEEEFKDVLPDTPIVEPVYQLEMYNKRMGTAKKASPITDKAVSLLSIVSNGIFLNEMNIADSIAINGTFENTSELYKFKSKIDIVFKCSSKLDWQDLNNLKKFEITFKPTAHSIKEGN